MKWLKEYRVRKLKEYIVGMEAELEAIEELMSKVKSIPYTYLDLAIETKKEIAISKEKLRSLSEK